MVGAVFGFLIIGRGPVEFSLKDGGVNKLLVTALMVVGLVLAAGAPAAAQTVVGYAGPVSQKRVGRRPGRSLNHKYRSVGYKQRTPRKARAKH